ncbi:MAG: HAMP domain-containing sensor histidine kinase [Methanoregula sp.]|nr:HAMP domain-containing sensor histidine kinase [Methanoregula sp.]
MQKYDADGSWWRSLDKPKPYAFAFLILLGLLLEFIVHFQLRIAVVYTHFYYLIIVVAGLWYGRKAIHIALLFGALHIADAYLTMGIISPDSLVRACMFVIVAVVVSHIAEQMNCYRDQLVSQNRELLEINTQLESSQKAFEIANKKLNLLSSITRHDIKNQLMALLGFIELSKRKFTDTEMMHFIEREDVIAHAIQRQIEFTKNYENIGVHAPTWQDIGVQVKALQTHLPSGEIEVSVTIEGLEIFADPLLEKVFENLIDNSRRHGERVRHISLSSMQHEQDSLVIVYEDDGVGVPEAEKERIFEKGFGKNTGLGLFLTREILAITGLTIRESGVHGKGARFEILVPKGKFRSTQPATVPK